MMRVAVGVVTGRRWCRAWLEWNLARIAYRPLELVVVGAADVCSIKLPGDVVARVIPTADAPNGLLRNVVLEHATSPLVTWIDDDDWHHPLRIGELVRAYERAPAWQVGWRHGWVADVASDRCVRFEALRPFNGSSIYELERARSEPYDDGVRGSDSRWLAALRARFGDPRVIDGRGLDVYALFLRHGTNTAPEWPHGRPLKRESARRRVPIGWDDTDERLAELAAAAAG